MAKTQKPTNAQELLNIHNTGNSRPPRPLEELNLIDNFLFQEMMMYEEGKEACKILLSTILGRPIRNVRIIPQKSVLGINTGMHGICMDAYIEDISDEDAEDGNVSQEANTASAKSTNTTHNANITNTVNAASVSMKPDIYDIEPNRTYEKSGLPKRMRYYHALIDAKLLDAGINYSSLQNVVIIVILPYDPFGRNRMVYTVRNRCIEDASIPYDDGAGKIFLYTKGSEGKPSQELRDMLKYMENTTEENVTNRDIEALHRLVCKVKERREVGISYMKSWEYEQMCREEARNEGLQEGREEGRQEALADAQLSAIRNLMLKLKMTAEQAMDTLEIAGDKRTQYSAMIDNNR